MEIKRDIIAILVIIVCLSILVIWGIIHYNKILDPQGIYSFNYRLARLKVF